jgi:hypothetical protein
MLDFAYSHDSDINNEYRKLQLSGKHKGAFSCGYTRYSIDIESTDWNTIQMVSMNGDRFNGYFEAQLRRDSNRVSSLFIFSVEDGNKLTYGRDLVSFFKLLLGRFNKVNFNVNVGHYMEEVYDRIVERLGGRVVGIYKDHVTLPNGKLVDKKVYEIMCNDNTPEIKKEENKTMEC